METVSIHKMSIGLCRNCRYSLFNGENCLNCGEPWKSVVYWTDEGGDMLFELVSDVRPADSAK